MTVTTKHGPIVLRWLAHQGHWHLLLDDEPVARQWGELHCYRFVTVSGRRVDTPCGTGVEASRLWRRMQQEHAA
jgi:hypothetical protein